MQIGVVFPQTEIGAAVADVRAYGQARRGARVRPRARLRPRARRRSRGARAVERPVRRAHHVPRAVRAVRLPRRRHGARARHRRHHPAAAPDGARRQAGRRGRPADRRPLPARRRARLERRRVRGARADVRRPRAADGGADRAAASAAGPSRRSPTTASSSASPAPASRRCRVQRPIPIWIGGQSAAGLPARRAARRRLVPAGAARARSSTRPARSSPRPPPSAGRDPASLGMEGRVSWTDGRRRQARRPGRPLARRRRDARVDQHDERRPRLGRPPPRGAVARGRRAEVVPR